MKTNQKAVHSFHASLASQSLAMLQAMLAMRACYSGLRTNAEAAWAATWLRPLFCLLMSSLPSRQSPSLWLPHTMWCTFFLCTSPSLGGVFFQFSSFFLLFLVRIVLLVLLLLLVSSFLVILDSRGPLEVWGKLELTLEGSKFSMHCHNFVFIW
jgi:hypothetical protein